MIQIQGKPGQVGSISIPNMKFKVFTGDQDLPLAVSG